MQFMRGRLDRPFAVASQREDRAPYRSTGLTVAHRILTLDREAEDVSDAIFKRLDMTLEAVRATVRPGQPSTQAEALETLGRIEATITSLNFVCSIPAFLVGSFTEGLTTRPLDPRVIYAPENTLRRPHVLAHQTDDFSHLDCDLGSLLYLAIGETLDLPLRMAEVPGHNFIRVVLRNDSQMNWDTNYGFSKYTDTDYADRHGVTPDLIVNGTYLRSFSPENVDGYFHFVRGLTFQAKSDLARAIAEYKSAILHFPQSPASRNNIAWLYASRRAAQNIVDRDEALQLSTRAVEIHRTGNALDTLACVCAEQGDFESATRYETEAYNMTYNPSYRRMVEAFKSRQTYLDVNPEAP